MSGVTFVTQRDICQMRVNVVLQKPTLPTM